MPSTRKQLNIRLDDEMEALIPALTTAVSAAIGISVSQADVVRLGLLALRERYLGGGSAPKKKSPKKPPSSLDEC